MKILTPGHRYELENFEQKARPGQVLQFIEKLLIPPGTDAAGVEQPAMLGTMKDGTTNEEVLAMLIDRLDFLCRKLPSAQTMLAVLCCKTALTALELRTHDRKERGVEGTPKA